MEGVFDFEKEMNKIPHEEAIKKLPFLNQTQRSLYDQMRAGHELARKFGLYDYADWLKREIQTVESKLK